MSLNTILATAPLTATGYHLKATGTTIGNSLIWDNGTNVGIGNTNTSYKLEVTGTLGVSGAATFISAAGITNGNGLNLRAGGNTASDANVLNFTSLAGTINVSMFSDASSSNTRLKSLGNLSFHTGNIAISADNERMTITSAGNVGIGTSSPLSKFAVKLSGATAPATVANTTGFDTTYVTFGNDTISGKQLGIGVSQTDQQGSYLISVAPASEWIDLSLYARNNIFYGNGTERMRITSAGWSKFSNTGTYLSPNGTFHQFNSDDVDDNTLQVYASSTSKTGNTFEVVCARSSSNLYNLIAAYSVTTLQFAIRGDGLIVGPGLISTHTTGSAANMHVDPANGAIYRSTSSLKYKKNVEDYSKGLDIVMQLRPVTYEGKNEIDEGKIFAGFIAEEIHDIGLTEYVQYAEDGTPDALAYQNMVALLTKAIQEQQIQIQNLQEQINILAK